MEEKKSNGLKLKTRLAITFIFITFMPPTLLSVIAASWMKYRMLFEEGMSIPIHQVRVWIANSLLITLIIQLGVAIILIIWSYRGMVGPIIKLNEATVRMAEGDFDFNIEARGQTKEIDRLCINFENMRKRLREYNDERDKRNQEQRKLISNIGHDLKTPVTAIKGYAEGIMDGVADTEDKKEKYIKTIYNKANDLDQLISELTYYSKIDNVNIPYEFMKINVSDYFSDCVEEVSIDLEEKGFEFKFDNNISDDVYVIADPIQMRKVINNIVGNSIKYNDKDKGKIEISISEKDDFVLIELSDNGCGISPKDLPNIFERFYRADSSRSTKTGGSGIGLSIVHKIIEDHGGRIWANSQLGKGTKMIIELRKYQEV